MPTVTVIVSAVVDETGFSLARVQALFSQTALSALGKSVVLSGSTALLGAVFGALLAWLIVTRPAESLLRRTVLSLCSVLAQFGGVALAFAFLATIESGQTPVVLDWDYLNVAESKKLPTWKVVIPTNAAVAGYYFQAINKDAPHPAAARLWQEFLYSDEGQNLYLQGGARPVRADTMVTSGTIDRAAYAVLPPVDGAATFVSVDQNAAATKYLQANWAKAVG